MILANCKREMFAIIRRLWRIENPIAIYMFFVVVRNEWGQHIDTRDRRNLFILSIHCRISANAFQQNLYVCSDM